MNNKLNNLFANFQKGLMNLIKNKVVALLNNYNDIVVDNKKLNICDV